MTLAETLIPRSRSIFIQSDRVRRFSPRARTWPAARIAPPASSRFSVRVVLPASGWEMIAKVRRLAAWAASPDRELAASAARDVVMGAAGSAPGLISQTWPALGRQPPPDPAVGAYRLHLPRPLHVVEPGHPL